MKKNSQGFYQGRFVPANPDKYKGDPNKIIFRSSWELGFARFLDRNINVIEWSSEEIVIPYVKPTDNRVHRYFPDFWVKFKDNSGNIKEEVIEVKPRKEWIPAMTIVESNFKIMPPEKSKNPKTRLRNQITMLINARKWEAAIKWCEERGMKFRVADAESSFK